MSDPLIFRDDIERAGWFAIYAAVLASLSMDTFRVDGIEQACEAWADDTVRVSRKRTPEPRDPRACAVCGDINCEVAHIADEDIGKLFGDALEALAALDAQPPNDGSTVTMRIGQDGGLRSCLEPAEERAKRESAYDLNSRLKRELEQRMARDCDRATPVASDTTALDVLRALLPCIEAGEFCDAMPRPWSVTRSDEHSGPGTPHVWVLRDALDQPFSDLPAGVDGPGLVAFVNALVTDQKFRASDTKGSAPSMSVTVTGQDVIVQLYKQPRDKASNGAWARELCGVFGWDSDALHAQAYAEKTSPGCEHDAGEMYLEHE